MRVRSRAVASIAALAVVATGCAGTDPEAAEEGSLVVAVREGDNNVAPILVDMWNEQNPDFPASLEVLQGNADQVRQQLTLELDAQGDEFDVIGLDVIWTGEFAENGWIEELEDLRADAEGASLPGPLESGQFQGTQWALPLLVGAGFLYYRTDLVDGEPPRTWDELVEMGLQISEEEGVHAYAAQGASYEGLVVNYLEYLWSAGGDLFNEDQTEVVFGTDDAALQALEFMRDAHDRGFYHPGYNTMTEAEARPAFESGEVAFMRHWVAPYLPMTESEESEVTDVFDIAPLPTFDGEGSVSALGGLNLAVSAYSSEQDMAREFIRWATTDEDVQLMLTDNGIAPANADIYDHPELEGERFFEVLGELLPHARPRPPVPAWNQISVTMQEEVFAAYTGQKDPQAAIDAIREMLEGVVAE